MEQIKEIHHRNIVRIWVDNTYYSTRKGLQRSIHSLSGLSLPLCLQSMTNIPHIFPRYEDCVLSALKLTGWHLSNEKCWVGRNVFPIRDLEHINRVHNHQHEEHWPLCRVLFFLTLLNLTPKKERFGTLSECGLFIWFILEPHRLKPPWSSGLLQKENLSDAGTLVQRTTAQSRQSQVTEGKCEWEWRDVLSCGVCVSVGGSEWVDTCLHVNYIYLTQNKTALKGVGPFDCSCLSIIFVPEKTQGVWSLQTRYWHFIQESLPCFLLLASIKCLSAKKQTNKQKKVSLGLLEVYVVWFQKFSAISSPKHTERGHLYPFY